MPRIQLTTIINAPVERCFDLARSIDFHVITTSHTNEKAIAGKTSGLISKDEQVTWRAKHFGVYQNLTSVITGMDPPFFFEDRMLKGAFKKIEHKHFFEWNGGRTIMKDDFFFEAPFGMLGKLFSRLVLKRYLQKFLMERNQLLKTVAESEKWKDYLA
ncbi:MAG TPA: SRPBCC family protein [Bacteroidia bacterium]|jgi:ligand-binding SRPBCC domain-containing protein